MNYTTVEVVLENGVVSPSGSETLPERARALLTVLESPDEKRPVTVESFIEQWKKIPRLSPEEAETFARDIEEARASLPPLAESQMPVL